MKSFLKTLIFAFVIGITFSVFGKSVAVKKPKDLIRIVMSNGDVYIYDTKTGKKRKVEQVKQKL